MRNRLILASVLFLMGMAQTVFAVSVDSIYEAEIPVATQSEPDKAQAIPKGLEQVLVKVSGDSHVIQAAKVAIDPAKANALLQETSYSKPAVPNPALPYLILTRFDPQGVNRLLRDAGVPIWGENRPLILGWVEYEVPGRPAEIIENTSINPVSGLFKEYALRRGLPLIFPVMDVADLGKISVNDIVTLNVPVVTAASNRYASDAILMARVFQLTDGFSTQAQLMMGQDTWNWKTTGKTLSEAIAALMDNVADTLAGRYATVLSNAVQSRVTLKITNVVQQNDFSQVMDYIRHLAPVDSADLISVTGGNLVVKLNLRGTSETFTQAVSAEKHLTPMIGGVEGKTLVYRWNP